MPVDENGNWYDEIPGIIPADNIGRVFDTLPADMFQPVQETDEWGDIVPLPLEARNGVPNPPEYYQNIPREAANRTYTATGRWANANFNAINPYTYGDIGGNDWSPKEYKDIQKKKNVVTINKETFEAISELSIAMQDEQLQSITNIYELRLDLIKNKDYNNLAYSFNNDDANITAEHAYRNFCYIGNGFEAIESGKDLNDHHWYLQNLEVKALQKYDKNHSKYRFYPRLLEKVKYGNAEMLSNIFNVTRIQKGKVICK